MDSLLLDLLLRWTHFLAGIIWIGHNYSSVVQRPTYQPLCADDLNHDDSPRFQALLHREHGIFRWAAVVAWCAGMLLLWRRDMVGSALSLTGAMAPMGIGVYIGTLMLLNLWLVLWPHQKKVLGLKPATVAERLRCSRITHLSSRTNTMLSLPLLFFMGAGVHGGAYLFQ